ncbi:RING finger protein 145-like [Dreissena polymorpha]|uniref:RING finger protein 145-like n=1 Tax=Dreissena polymorpha TaxID=45954 RepID=UPI00226564D2|nr:RING finger protein 145-like [Dreissena polymorpha]
MMADNAREDIQQEPDVTNQTKGWIEMCGVRLDNVLDRTHGNRKVIIEGIFRMPFVFMLFAWTTLGPSADSRLLEIPCLLCRYLGMLKWMAHAQTGFQTILPLYVDAVLCFTSAWLCQAIYWTLQAQNEAACFLDELGIAFSDTYPSRKITFISALVVRSLYVHRVVNKTTEAFWYNITLTIITLLSISTKWYLFMQLDYWSMQYINFAFMINRYEDCSKSEINRLNALKKATDIQMRSTTDETVRLVCFEKIEAYSMLITMHTQHKFSWKAVSYFSNQCIFFFIFQTAIVALVEIQTGFNYIERNIYCYVVLCCFNIISGFGLATLFSKILEDILCLLARFVFQSSNPNTNTIRIEVVSTMMILYIDSNLFLLDVNTRQHVLLTILLMALSQVMLLVVGSVELEILSIINEGARNKLFKLFGVLITTAFILSTYLYISSNVAMKSGIGGWTFLFLSRNVVVLAKVFFLFLKSVILFSSRFPSCFQEHLDNIFFNMHAISNISVLVCVWLHCYTRLFAPNMGSFFLIRLFILTIDTLLKTSIACYAEWKNYLVRNQLQGFIKTLPEIQEHDENEVCSVCLTPLGVSKQLPCGHAFHYDCLKRWFRIRTVCPLCNIEVQIPEIDDRIGHALRTFINNNQ